MARVTVDDCLAYVDNAFELVLKATDRARELQLGEAEPLVPLDNDKPTVLALREIAMGDAFVEALEQQRREAAQLADKGFDDFEEAIVSEREIHEGKMAEEQRVAQKNAEIEHYFDAFNQHAAELDQKPAPEAAVTDTAVDAPNNADVAAVDQESHQPVVDQALKEEAATADSATDQDTKEEEK